MQLTAIFLNILGVTVPVFAMVFIGIGLRRLGWIDERFINTASALVFKGTLPTLIFLSIIQANLDTALDPALLGYFAIATLSGFLLSWLWASQRVRPAQRGVYVQGAFRGNCGIVGLALAANMYGDYGLSVGGLLMIVVTLCYNPCSVLVLTNGQRNDWRRTFTQIIGNPMVVAALLALAVTWSGLSLPNWLLTTGHYFASLTLPLALICTGGALSLTALHAERAATLGASTLKMITLPTLATGVAWLVGFSGTQLGMLFMFFASPTAVSSFVMAQILAGDARLAANIIALTTLMAGVTITGGLFVLRVAGLI